MGSTEFVVNVSEFSKETKLEEVKRETESIFKGVIVSVKKEDAEESCLLLENEGSSEPMDWDCSVQWIQVIHPVDSSLVFKARDFILAHFEPEWKWKGRISALCLKILLNSDHFWLNLLQALYCVTIKPVETEPGPEVEVSGDYDRVCETQRDVESLCNQNGEEGNDAMVRRDFLICVTQSGVLKWPDYSSLSSSLLGILSQLFRRAKSSTNTDSRSSSPEILRIVDRTSHMRALTVDPQLFNNPEELPLPATPQPNSAPVIPIISSVPSRTQASTSTQSSRYGSEFDQSEYAGTRKSPESLLRPVILDACNVGFSKGGNVYLDVKGILLALKYFIEKGHKCEAVMPESFSLKFERPRTDKKISDRHLLDKMKEADLLVFTPVRQIPEGSSHRVQITSNYDDLVILQRAATIGGVVVSRDRFRDIYRQKEEYREIIKSRVIIPIWFKDDLQFAPDGPVGRTGRSHEETMKIGANDRDFIQCLDHQLTKCEQKSQLEKVSRLMAECTGSTRNERRKRSRSYSPEDTERRPKSAGLEMESASAREPGSGGVELDSSINLMERIIEMGFDRRKVEEYFRQKPNANIEEAVSVLTAYA